MDVGKDKMLEINVSYKKCLEPLSFDRVIQLERMTFRLFEEYKAHYKEIKETPMTIIEYGLDKNIIDEDYVLDMLTPRFNNLDGFVEDG